MQHQHQDEQALDMNEMSLREHLLAAQAAGQAHPPPIHDPSSMSPNGQNIDPAIGGSPYDMEPGDDGEVGPDGKKGRQRELSSSKRAAQNRAAQRAFRQRKEGYIKKLEEQVRNFNALEESYKHLQGENYDLRAYILTLQSRLLESEGGYPPPPPSISVVDMQRGSIHGSHHSHQQHPHLGAPTVSMTGVLPPPPAPGAPYGSATDNGESMGPAEVSQLQAAAAAAQAGDYPGTDDDLKHAQARDEEEAYAIEAANAAYAASRASAKPRQGSGEHSELDASSSRV